MSNDPLMNISNLAYVEELYASYLRDPGSVSAEWQATFQAMPDDPFTSNPALEPTAAPSSIFNPPSNGQSTEASHPDGLANGYSNGAMRSDAPSARPAERCSGRVSAGAAHPPGALVSCTWPLDRKT